MKNTALTPSEYKKEREKYENKSTTELLQEFSGFLGTQVRRSSNFTNVLESYGENLQNTIGAKFTFDGADLENVYYSYFVDALTDSMDINYGQGNTTLQYESLGTGANAHRGLFSLNIWPDVTNLVYCDSCSGSSHLFLCTGLRNKSYCILNRQYTKEEYEALIPRIIEKMMSDEEWGEFFPASMSPFGYNETVANEYYPMTREEVLSNLLEKGGDESVGRSGGLVLGEQDTQKPQSSVTSGQLLSQGAPNDTFLHGPIFNWSDYEPPFPKVEKIIPANKLPDMIESIPDDILNWAVECEVSGKPFRIIRQELEFYRKHHLPIPRRHPDIRHMDRIKKRNPRKLFERKCDKCEKDMITTYSPERSERVYCEECYLREVVR